MYALIKYILGHEKHFALSGELAKKNTKTSNDVNKRHSQ